MVGWLDDARTTISRFKTFSVFLVGRPLVSEVVFRVLALVARCIMDSAMCIVNTIIVLGR
jgi:hypothetical protein